MVKVETTSKSGLVSGFPPALTHGDIASLESLALACQWYCPLVKPEHEATAQLSEGSGTDIHVGMPIKAVPIGFTSTSSWTSVLSGSKTKPSNIIVFSFMVPPKGTTFTRSIESHCRKEFGWFGGVFSKTSKVEGKLVSINVSP